ncbi:MAG: DUF2281 domain-containing protein [Nevskiaceae bacterium]|jgi:hypothetical protein|nr:DUF2281 domain-containing protein [Nevskiaceae bacterium]
MNARRDDLLIQKLRNLPSPQRAEVEDFVDFLAAKTQKRAAFDRLLAIAPTLQAAGAEPLSEEDIAAEIQVARAERRAHRQKSL